MSRLKYFNELLAKDKFVFVGHSSCWDWHNSGFGAKNSNIIKDCAALFDKNPQYDKFLVVRGAIGRSAHSKTTLLIYAKKGDWAFVDGSFFNEVISNVKFFGVKS